MALFLNVASVHCALRAFIYTQLSYVATTAIQSNRAVATPGCFSFASILLEICWSAWDHVLLGNILDSRILWYKEEFMVHSVTPTSSGAMTIKKANLNDHISTAVLTSFNVVFDYNTQHYVH